MTSISALPDTLRRRLAIASVLFAMAAAVLDASSVNIALPSIATALRIDPAVAAWLLIAYQGALVAGLLPLAAVGERFGYRLTFVAGVALFTLCAFASSIAPTFPSLVAFRAVQGVGAAAIMALGVALLRQTVAEGDFGRAIGWNAMTVALFSAAGPTIGALLIGLGSWRFAFAGSVLLAGMALVGACSLPSWRSVGKKLDSVGLLAYVTVIPAFVLAAGFVRQSLLAAMLLSAVGGLGLWGLVRRDLRRNEPFLPLPLFRSPSFTLSVLASVLCFFAMGMALLILPFALHDRLGLSARDTALVMTPWPLAVLFTTPITSRLLERVQPAQLCAAGGLVLACGLSTLTVAPLALSIPVHILGVMLCGIGFGLFQTPNNRTMFLSAPIDRAASAGGVQGTARLAGQVTGALSASILLSVGSVNSAASFVFGTAAIAAVASASVSWWNWH
ncbi:DHA2 family multidrug resistance protein-like MFS transporter [Sphingopyxis sp. OAS728]|uniref:MFS transporter n=1 Tax=Sphingopyxis sp. OAS728 TaxID=2663823 RepID=UPI00178BD1D1|nr:MFS transporter [Sphingopyxis sp. OAS728]MBE1527103.1 DHA2 family multidrug resistance protein-like MFS transporter [Sphingopyxis sp. OAS728]